MSRYRRELLEAIRADAIERERQARAMGYTREVSSQLSACLRCGVVMQSFELHDRYCPAGNEET